MSMEVGPLHFEFCQVQYHLFPSVCDEFRDQIDFIRVVRIRDQMEVTSFRPNEAANELEKQAAACARDHVDSLEWDEGDMVIDYADCGCE